MKYLVDTNVVSELTKREPNRKVLAFLSEHEEDIFLSVITVEEMRFGMLCMPEGKRRDMLSSTIDSIMDNYASRLLAFDASEARLCAEYHHSAISKGHHPTIEDLMIAAICTNAGATLITRNTKDFEYLEIPLINPFEQDCVA